MCMVMSGDAWKGNLILLIELAFSSLSALSGAQEAFAEGPPDLPDTQSQLRARHSSVIAALLLAHGSLCNKDAFMARQKQPNGLLYETHLTERIQPLATSEICTQCEWPFVPLFRLPASSGSVSCCSQSKACLANVYR